jgi:phosphomannomutase
VDSSSGDTDSEALFEHARWWAENDPDTDLALEISRLLDAEDGDGIDALFGAPLGFGTAGIRGPLGAGPAHVNRMVVRLTTLGLTTWLAARKAKPRVVVGFDARHRSDEFGREVADVVTSTGGVALLGEVPLPTPVLAWAVGELEADAGVMVTASHNPPADNGYKAYESPGSQLLPSASSAVESAADELTGTAISVEPDPANCESVGAEIIDRYLDAIVPQGLVDGVSELTVAYSAMHGVGGETTRRLAERIGFTLSPVAEQYEPDPDFPTVAFPNPEEPGASDLLLAHAEAIDADLAFAHDPDADRLAVATLDAGKWRQLSGNEVGRLLGDHLLARSSGPNRVVSTTVVSSNALEAIADAHGAQCVRTLTGSKWVIRPGLDMPDHRFVFGYEEALGYSVNDVVHEKDGISAALIMFDLVASLRFSGHNVVDRLEELAQQHGRFGEAQRIVMTRDPDAYGQVQRGLEWLRGCERVDVDAHSGTITDYRDGVGDLLPADMIAVEFAGHGRVLIRPSGTEPKLKVYSEVRTSADVDRPTANAEASSVADAVMTLVRANGENN